MSYERSKQELFGYIYATYQLVHVTTKDEQVVVRSLVDYQKISAEPFKLITWNRVGGFVSTDEEVSFADKYCDPIEALRYIRSYQGDAVFIMHDLQAFYNNYDKTVMYHLKDTVQAITVPFEPPSDVHSKRYPKSGSYYKTIVLTAADQHVPLELSHIMSVMDFALPGRAEIAHILDCALGDEVVMVKGEKKKIIQASLGLTETELYNVYSLSMVTDPGGKVDYHHVTREKKQIIKKDGILEYKEPKSNLDDVGGLHELIDWAKRRRMAFDEETRAEYGLNPPKGVLLTGIQGCGKSLCGEAFASLFEVPFIKMDIGAIMGKWLGESEARMRTALKSVESISPCVLFIDEVDKGIPDAKGENSHDTKKAVLGYLLNWMQENVSSVFVIMTANNVHVLPPELIRKGRLDELFFVNLPNREERKSIFSIHLKKKQRNPLSFDLDQLVKASEGYSGSEIEAVIGEALFLAASEKSPLTTAHVLKEMKRCIPLSVTMKDKLDAIRDWAEKHQLRSAT